MQMLSDSLAMLCCSCSWPLLCTSSTTSVQMAGDASQKQPKLTGMMLLVFVFKPLVIQGICWQQRDVLTALTAAAAAFKLCWWQVHAQWLGCGDAERRPTPLCVCIYHSQ